MLAILAAHPSTAKFIANKLTHWLLRYDPTPSFVADIAGVYLKTGGDIKAMIRAILAEATLKIAPAKYKRPYHFVVSALRTVMPTPSNSNGIRNALSAMGQVPFHWSPPNGYPDALEYWSGLILPRWNFGLALMRNSVDGLKADVSGLAGMTAQALADRVDAQLFAGEMPHDDKADLVAYLGAKPTELRVREAVGLALASPGFQWY